MKIIRGEIVTETYKRWGIEILGLTIAYQQHVGGKKQ